MTGQISSEFFHRAMRACMIEDRPPRDVEIEELAAKIWDEAFRRDAQVAWDRVEHGSRSHKKTVAAAYAAFGAPASFMLNLSEPAGSSTKLRTPPRN